MARWGPTICLDCLSSTRLCETCGAAKLKFRKFGSVNLSRDVMESLQRLRDAHGGTYDDTLRRLLGLEDASEYTTTIAKPGHGRGAIKTRNPK